jgi:hypothetical protein
MKKTLIALAALAATSAFAQSSVTMSGSINYGIATAVTNIHTYGGWKGDRNHLTFTAVEDLGGGMKVTAMLQARYSSDTGAQSASYVASSTGLQGDNLFEQSSLALDSGFGQVRVGRFTNAIGVAPLHVLEDAAQTTASHMAANGRWSAQTQYLSPVVAGAQLFILNAQKRSNVFQGGGTGAGYNVGMNMCTQDPSQATVASTACTAISGVTGQRWANLNAVGINYNNGPLYAQAYQITDFLGQRQTKIGATYDLGVVKLHANQFNQKTDIKTAASAASTTATAAWGTVGAGTGFGAKGMAAHKATELAVSVPYGAWNFQLGRFSASKDLAIGVTDGSTQAVKTGMGANYALSKRTTLIYAASSTSKGGPSSTTSEAKYNVLNNGSTLNGRNQFVGIQHTF